MHAPGHSGIHVVVTAHVERHHCGVTVGWSATQVRPGGTEMVTPVRVWKSSDCESTATLVKKASLTDMPDELAAAEAVDMVGSTGAETSAVALRSIAAISLALTVTMVPLTAPSAVEPEEAAGAGAASGRPRWPRPPRRPRRWWWGCSTRLVPAAAAAGAAPSLPPRKAAAASWLTAAGAAAAAAGWLTGPMSSAGGGGRCWCTGTARAGSCPPCRWRSSRGRSCRSPWARGSCSSCPGWEHVVAARGEGVRRRERGAALLRVHVVGGRERRARASAASA